MSVICPPPIMLQWGGVMEESQLYIFHMGPAGLQGQGLVPKK